MRILVTGGTGFVGKHLLARLLAEGNEIIVFSRKMDDELIDKVVFVNGDIRDKDALEKAFPCDVVYHLAAAIEGSASDIFDVNIDGTRNVAELCRKHGASQLIFMSSIAALGDTGVAREDSRYNAETPYEKSKAEGEKIVMNSGVPYTIIRAPVIMGPTPTWAKVFYAAKKKLPIIGPGTNTFHAAYVGDVADLLFAVKGNKKAFGMILHVATTDTPTYLEFYAMLCEQMKTETTKTHVPVIAAKAAAVVYELFSAEKDPIITRANINRLTRDRRVEMVNIKRIGFEPKHDTRSALKRTFKYLRMAKLGYNDFEIAEKGLLDDKDRQD